MTPNPGADAPEPVFRRDRDRFIPTASAASPWGSEVLHGGPPSGLLARAIERSAADAEMQVARLTTDLFRAVPMAPLEVRVEPARAGRRIAVMQASLLADGVEVARTTGSLLRRFETPATPIPSPPRGPDGIETTTLSRGAASLEAETGFAMSNMRRGFHTEVRTRWVTAERDEAPPTVWFTMPMPLVEGEETSPLVRAAALSDFGNALAQMMPRPGLPPGAGYINTDITLYLDRLPEGEWICLQADHRAERDGIGLVEVVQYDARGRYGRSVQARLANPRS